MNIEILIIIAIIIALGVIAGFGILVSRIFRRKTISSASNLRISFSSEETLSQLFFLLSVFFLAITAISFSRNLGNVIEWPLVILSSSFISIFLSYRFKGVLLLPVSLIGLFSWWFLKASEWTILENPMEAVDADIKDLSLFSLPLLFSLFLYIIGLIHGQNRKFERYAAVYNVLPVIAITVALFFVSTELGIEALEEMTVGADIFNSWQLLLSYILGGAIFAGGIFYSLGKNIARPVEGAVLFIYGAVFGLSVFLPDISKSLYLAAFLNIFLLIHLVALLFAGYLKKKDWFINLGSLSLFVFIIVKYFDWAFDFLDKSVFFISAGILLLVLGWFMEKGRRYMLSSSKIAV